MRKFIRFGKEELPKFLYHGASMKFNKDLMPGYLRTGALLEWDNTESNKYLYASTEVLVAVDQGFASAVERLYWLKRYQSTPHEIIITVETGKALPKQADLLKLRVFLHQIRPREEHGWVKNANQHNGLTNEWKTERVIEGEDFTVREVNIREFLKDKKLTIRLDPSR